MKTTSGLCGAPKVTHSKLTLTSSSVVGVLGNVVSYSGFLRVDAKYDSNLFFWFVPKEKEPEKGDDSVP